MKKIINVTQTYFVTWENELLEEIFLNNVQQLLNEGQIIIEIKIIDENNMVL